MYQPVYTRQFRKDIKRIQKSGNKDIEKLKSVVMLLLDGKQLDPCFRDHNLRGNFRDCRECHIEPNWLLLYRIKQSEQTIVFVRTGSHSDTFG